MLSLSGLRTVAGRGPCRPCGIAARPFAALALLAVALLSLTTAHAETPQPAPAAAAPAAATPAAQPAPTAPQAQTPAAAAPAAAAPHPAPPAANPDLDEALLPVKRLQTAMDSAEKTVARVKDRDDELARQRGDLEGIEAEAVSSGETLRPKLEAVRAQIEKLGPAPGKDAPPEAATIAAERARLNGIAAHLDGAIKSTELVAERARQLIAQVQALRHDIFTRDLLRRTPSPLLPTIWRKVGAEVPGALRQISVITSDWWHVAASRALDVAALFAGVTLLYLALAALRRRLLAAHLDAPRDRPPSFFRRAAAAGWVAPLLALPGAAALVTFYAGLDALGLLYLQVADFMTVTVLAALLVVAVRALIEAQLQPRRPTWRLLDVSDRAAISLSRTVNGIATIYGADLMLNEGIRILFLPLSVSVAEAFVASVAFATLLLAFVRTRFEPLQVAPTPPAPVSRLWPRWIKLPLLAVALLIVGASLLGYIALGRFMAGQVVLTGSVAMLVVLLHLAIKALTGPQGEERDDVSRVLEVQLGLDSNQSRQFSRGLSLLLNALLAVVAVPLVLLTWGFSLPEILAWLKAAMFGFEVGQFRISLVRILLAIGLFLGLAFLTRLIQRWLSGSLLSPARMDAGIANSIHTGIGYAGFALAALAAISYGGLDITNLAIVAGALSVGIGFGLQSIVNNFVSGLILLVERPIKVGDLISVKGQDGFVRRISVRSTEIETSGKASLILPNSELISNAVTNWTHRNALGRVSVKVAVSYKSDPDQVVKLLTKVASDSAAILQHPAPGVSLEAFGANGLEFSLSVAVPDITKGGGVQSELRTAILKAFREAGIEMPYAQHDVHLRDLDGVRQAVSRLMEERARQAAQKAAEGLTSPKA